MPRRTVTEPFAALALGSPLGRLVRGVARLRASVHAKLLAGFLLVTLLFLAMGGVSLAMLLRTARHTRLLDEAHQRVEWSRQIEHALAAQMHLTAMALLVPAETRLAEILRQNNRFNDTLARLEAAAPDEERALIRDIRAAQDDAMAVVADIANSIRDRRMDEAVTALRDREEPLRGEIEGLVGRLVAAEQVRMTTLRESVEAANRRSLVLLAAFGAGSILLALLCGFVISWSFILPVREAHTFLGEVAAGRFDTSISVPNRDEFGDLAERMNRMSRELARLEAERRQAAEAVLAASRAKSEFLANMSHELRTPLNAILGFTEMVIDGVYGPVPPELEEPMTDIQTNGRHLLRLINDVLDLSKIEAGRMELTLGEYSVQEVVDSVRSSLRSLAAEKGLALTAAVQDGLPAAYGDGKRLTQCLLNLVGNAIKFTRRGSVELGVSLDDGMLLYQVRDTGIGVPKEEIERIFDEFRQVDATITREYGGTGLGLSITRRLVEMHGGRIWAESVVGEGSTFSFSVPLRVAPDAADARQAA